MNISPFDLFVGKRLWCRFPSHPFIAYGPRQHNTTQRNATQRNAAQRNATQSNATQRSTAQWCLFCRLQPAKQNKTTDVVIHQHSRKLLKMDILMSETRWAHNKWNKIASDIKLVFRSSTRVEFYIARGIWNAVLMVRCYVTIKSSEYQVLAFNLRVNKPINQ